MQVLKVNMQAINKIFNICSIIRLAQQLNFFISKSNSLSKVQKMYYGVLCILLPLFSTSSEFEQGKYKILQEKFYCAGAIKKKFVYICAPAKKVECIIYTQQFFEIPDFIAGVAQLARAADL